MAKTTENTEKATKVTKRDYFNKLDEILVALEMDEGEKTALRNFIAHEKELLARKAENKSTNSKTTAEQEIAMADIKTALAAVNKPITVGDLIRSSAVLTEKYNASKVTAMLKKLIEKNEVVRVEEKKKAYFSIVKEEA